MTEVSVYKLTNTPLEKTLPKLMEKVISGGMRAVILASSKEQVKAFNTLLWTYSTTTFLPHGSEEDNFAEDQPIWLTTLLENPNNAQVLVLCNGETLESINEFQRCLDLYDGNDPEVCAKAATRIKAYQNQNHKITLWQQGPKGTWEIVTP